MDTEGRFNIIKDKNNNNSFSIETKAHGHGDVHQLLYRSKLVQKWKEANKKWIIFFQDTNPLVFRALPAVLGVSKQKNFEMNSITVPRKPGEEVGAICKLVHKDQPNKFIETNIEYNILD